MKRIFLALAFLASTVGAAPSIQSSQFTAFNGNSVVAAIPAGAAGDMLVAFVAIPCPTAGGAASTVPGWLMLANVTLSCGTVSMRRFSDGTETSVTIPLTVSVTGQALVIRVSGAVGAQSGPTSAIAMGGPNAMYMNYPPSAPTLWLTFANALALPVLAPSGYSNALSAKNGNAALMLAEKSSTAEREDAGAWVLSSPVIPWRAQTIGIR